MTLTPLAPPLAVRLGADAPRPAVALLHTTPPASSVAADRDPRIAPPAGPRPPLVRRHAALWLGLLAGILGALVVRAALDPARWFPADLGRVYVIGTCSYSRVVVDMLAADPAAPWVALPLPAGALEFEAPVCDAAIDRLTEGGAWWLAAVPRASACHRLQQWAKDQYERETPAQGFPAWVSAAGEFRGFGIDPKTIADLGLTPTPKIVDFWVDGGYAKGLVESLGFRVPATTRQGPAIRSPHVEPEPHPG